MGRKKNEPIEYQILTEPFTFEGVLMGSEWDAKRPCMSFYFDDKYDKNGHYELQAWWKPQRDERGNYYIPGYDGNILDLELGSVVHCECDITKSGRIGWIYAYVFDEKMNIFE